MHQTTCTLTLKRKRKAQPPAQPGKPKAGAPGAGPPGRQKRTDALAAKGSQITPQMLLDDATFKTLYDGVVADNIQPE